MRRSNLTTALVLAAAMASSGCTSSSTPPMAGQGTDQPTGVSGGGTLLSIVGTPFLIAFKIPFCAASLAVAAPLAGLASLTPDDTGGRDTRQALSAGLQQNCGPPYAIAP